MRLKTRQTTILLCSVALLGMAGAADARPLQKHHRSVATQVAAPSHSGADSAQIHAFMRADWERTHGNRQDKTSSRARGAPLTSATAAYAAAPAVGGFGGSSLVSEARKYLGTNPTGRRSLWCGAFMDLVLKRTGRQGGGNLATDYARYGTRVSGPQVGAIAVMRRKGGGHVGIVSGVDSNGNPIVVSGNHNNTVAEAVYPRSRVVAYVMPGG